jgi:hypothetical protein
MPSERIGVHDRRKRRQPISRPPLKMMTTSAATATLSTVRIGTSR